MMRCSLLAAFAALVVSGPAIAQLVVAEAGFDFNVAGWTGGPGPVWVPSGAPSGEGDGYLSISPSSLSGFMAIVSTSDNSAFNFDYAAAGVFAVEVDLMNPASSTGPVAIRTVLFGPTDASTHRWTSTEASLVPADGIWRRYRFDLDLTSLVRVQGTASLAATLGDVRGIMFRHDPGTPNAGGSNATGLSLAVDNIRLLAIPEPGSLGMGLAGLLSAAAYFSRRGTRGS